MVLFLYTISDNKHKKQAASLKLLYIYLFMKILWCTILKRGHPKKSKIGKYLFQLSIKYFPNIY